MTLTFEFDFEINLSASECFLFSSISISIPKASNPFVEPSLTGAEFSPIPAVKTKASIPFNTA